MKKLIWTYIIFNYLVLPTFSQEEKPNIMLIVADQMIPFLTSPYGNEVAITPNLEKMANNGVLFEAAYTPNPICAPARACLMAGKSSTILIRLR